VRVSLLGLHLLTKRRRLVFARRVFSPPSPNIAKTTRASSTKSSLSAVPKGLIRRDRGGPVTAVTVTFPIR
jgi:hypothetical protein